MVMAPASKRENVVGAFIAITRPRPMMIMYSVISSNRPIRPNSSPNTARMKSVDRSGMKSSWDWLPLSQPLPNTPPEPIAMVDWMM